MTSSGQDPAAPDRFGAFVAFDGEAPGGDGPLAGVRVAVKDNIAVTGLPFAAGHPLFENRIAGSDATAVRKLRQAGARIVGVTRTDAGGFGVSTPEVVNPIAPERTVGGSSGGSAAAVAADLADVALGTDTGGSVRIPAACTGLIGFKPTRNRISLEGVWPLSLSLDHVGVIGRDLDLVRRTARCLIEFEPKPSGVTRDRTLRVGIDQNLARNWHPTVREAFDRLIAVLEQRSPTILALTLPDRDRAIAAHHAILFAEAREIYRSLSPAERDRLGKAARRALPLADGITVDMLADARRVGADVTATVERLFDQADVILTPTLACPVPARDARRVEIQGRSLTLPSALVAETALFNLSGHPALALPTAERIEGVPFSVQIVGRLDADLYLFDVARKIAAALHFSAAPRG